MAIIESKSRLTDHLPAHFKGGFTQHLEQLPKWLQRSVCGPTALTNCIQWLEGASAEDHIDNILRMANFGRYTGFRRVIVSKYYQGNEIQIGHFTPGSEEEQVVRKLASDWRIPHLVEREDNYPIRRYGWTVHAGLDFRAIKPFLDQYYQNKFVWEYTELGKPIMQDEHLSSKFIEHIRNTNFESHAVMTSQRSEGGSHIVSVVRYERTLDSENILVLDSNYPPDEVAKIVPLSVFAQRLYTGGPGIRYGTLSRKN